MELWLLVESAIGTSAEVAIEVEPHHTVQMLADGLAARLGLASPTSSPLYSYRHGRTLAAADPVLSSGLRFGDHLSLGVPANAGGLAQSGNGTPVCVLSVIGGPSTGTRVALTPGTHLIGRGESCGVPLDDLALSREHVKVLVQQGADGALACRVADAGSRNGTFVDGRRLAKGEALPLGQPVEAGHTLFRLESLPPARPAADGVPGRGVIAFNRPPRMRPKAPDRIFKLSAPPDSPGARKIPLAGVIGPLVLGIPMVALGMTAMKPANGQPNTILVLGLTSMVGSLLMAVISFLEDRRSGRGAFRTKRLEFYEELHVLTERLATAAEEETRERRRLAPNAAELAERAAGPSPQLWERRPDDADFLFLSMGWADQPSTSVVEIGDGGDDTLRKEADEALATSAVIHNVPVVIDLARFGVAGVCGDASAAQGLGRWLLVQVASLHSPRDVVIAAAVAADEATDWSWVPWLPHTRSDSSPIEGNHLAVGELQASSLFETINGVIRARRDQRGQQLTDTRKPAPAVVVMMSDRLRVPRAAVTRVLEEGAGVGVYVIWLGSRRDDLPGECGAIVGVIDSPPTVSVTFPNLGTSIDRGAVDRISVAAARDIALALAPIRDVTAGGARGQIPRFVALAELLDLPAPTPEAIRQRWQQQPFGVRAPIGVSQAGTFHLDIRHDGPHALVGGTTGAGKSELLQTMVAALAASHPPNRVTFLLIDYKGGAAFKDAVHLPHTVGFVTDLDGHLVHRALVSLNAELRRREHLMRDHGAKDLLEMERRVPEAAPPSLLLIVDEFASLAKELPDFVDGVVNVAQRGRALGIHLILATQRPAGAINDNIRANTNLRIALRMNDDADSADVIGQKDAAMLPRTLQGRGFARTGQAELTEFQVAYVGGHTVSSGAVEASQQPLEVLDLRLGEVQRRATATGDEGEGQSDLQVMVDVIRRAASDERIPQQRSPWLAALPANLPASAFDDARSGRALIGLVDLPENQAQQPWFWDLETDGNLLVFGTSGAGKTTLLRTMAVWLAQRNSPDELHLYGLDFATRGLQPLSALPHTGSIVGGDDIERVQRLIVTLEREIARRKHSFAAVGASTLSEYQRVAPTAPLPRIVVLLDGYGGFTGVFDKVDFGEWIERLARLIGDGRPLGIHWVLTADRRAAVGLTLLTTIGSRVVLRMADDDEYSSLGLDGKLAKGTNLPPGRGFVGPTVEVQVAVTGDDISGDAQAAAIDAAARELTARHPSANVPRIASLPLEVSLAALDRPDPYCAAVGIGQSTLATVSIDLRDGNLLVAGPNRSGRSTVLLTMARSLRESTPGVQMYAVLARRSPLADADLWVDCARNAADAERLTEALADLLDERDGSEAPIVVFIDDGNELADTGADRHLSRIVRSGRDAAMHVIGGAESASALRCYGGWIPEMRKDRRGMILNPDPDIDGDLVSVRLPRRSGGGMPPGRGYLVLDGAVELVQSAS